MSQRFIHHPFRRGAQGVVGVTRDADRHLRDKVEAVLFTAPGERLNRPEFGAGLNQMVFEPIDEVTISMLEYRIAQALERDIGSEIIVDEVAVETDARYGELVLHLVFRRRRDRVPARLEITL